MSKQPRKTGSSRSLMQFDLTLWRFLDNSHTVLDSDWCKEIRTPFYILLL